MCVRIHNRIIWFILAVLLSHTAAPLSGADQPGAPSHTNGSFDVLLTQAAPPSRIDPDNRANTTGTTGMVGHPFAQGTWTFQLYGSGVTMDEDHGYISTAHLGLGYHLADDFSFNFEGIGGWVDSKTDDDGGVGGFDLLLRHHFAHDPNYHWTIYLDGGGGLQQATTNFPSDSHFNFRTQIGLGGTLQLKERLRLMGGARYMHVSNAGTTDGNDGGDWAQLYLGLMLDF